MMSPGFVAGASGGDWFVLEAAPGVDMVYPLNYESRFYW